MKGTRPVVLPGAKDQPTPNPSVVPMSYQRSSGAWPSSPFPGSLRATFLPLSRRDPQPCGK